MLCCSIQEVFTRERSTGVFTDLTQYMRETPGEKLSRRALERDCDSVTQQRLQYPAFTALHVCGFTAVLSV